MHPSFFSAIFCGWGIEHDYFARLFRHTSSYTGFNSRAGEIRQRRSDGRVTLSGGPNGLVAMAPIRIS